MPARTTTVAAEESVKAMNQAHNKLAAAAKAAEAIETPAVPEVLNGVMAKQETKTVATKPTAARKPTAKAAPKAAKPKPEQPARTAVVEVPLSTGNRLVPDRRGESPKVTTATADFLAWVAASYGVDLTKPISPAMLAVIATRKPQFQADIREANPRAKGK